MANDETLTGLAKQGVRFFLQFGGQGNSYLKECSRLYTEYPELNKFFDIVSESLLEELQIDQFKNSFNLRYGFDLMNWLKGNNLPPESYLSSCTISLTSIHITQMAYYHLLELNGAINDDVLDQTIGMTGHSQGIHSACLVSMRLKGEEFYKALRKFVKYYLFAGHVCQTVYPYRTVEEIFSTEMLGIAKELDLASPSPMAVVSGWKRSNLQNLLDEYNKGLEEKNRLTISLENTPQILVISGKSEDVFGFRRKNYNTMKSENIGWDYLEISVPFHCPILLDTSKLFRPDLEYFGFHFKGSDLKIPVYDTYAGKNVQDVNLLGEFLFILQTSQPLYWQNSLSSLLNDPSITHVIDFGPGRSSSFFTKEFLGVRPVKIMTVASRQGLRKLLSG